MRKLAVCLGFFMLVPVFAASACAQQTSKPADSVSRSDASKPPAHFYRLDFVLEDLDSAGKQVNSRSFSTILSTARTGSGSFAAGSKVPVIASAQASKDEKSGLMTQFQYIDIGIKIEISGTHEEGSNLAFGLKAEVSSLAAPAALNGVSEPVLRQNVWNGDVLIPVGKPTRVFKSDSLENKGSMQVEVTATPVN